MMNTIHWLRAADCPLLQTDIAAVEPSPSRLVLRLVELCLTSPFTDDLIMALLKEMATTLRADQLAVLEPGPQWPPLWQHPRPSARGQPFHPPRTLLQEVQERRAGVSRPPGPAAPALLAVTVPYPAENPYLLLVARSRDEFSGTELEYTLAAGHYLGLALEKVQACQAANEKCRRLEALVQIGVHLLDHQANGLLLEHIAVHALRLLEAEGAGAFVWEPSRKELVGRSAPGPSPGDLRLSGESGAIGQVMQTGRLVQLDNVQLAPFADPAVDNALGPQARDLLCVPLNDGEGQRLGVLMVVNKKHGQFTSQDAELLSALGELAAATVQNLRLRQALSHSNAEFDRQARHRCRIIGESISIQGLRGTLAQVARTEFPVLIHGESGTGKDLLARALHQASPRQGQPFICVPCADLRDLLLPEKCPGGQTDLACAWADTGVGRFAAAEGGTLFLDEVSDLNAGAQAQLLRFLEEKTIYDTGITQAVAVNARLVAATRQDLTEAVRAGKFRKDLFYRLCAVTLEVPPLRERQEDVLLLAEHFLQEFCREAGRRPLKLSAEARKRLLHYGWPGNVRELRCLLEPVAFFCPGDRVELDSLYFFESHSTATDLFSHLSLTEATQAFQVQHIKQAITGARGNMSDAARQLGLHRPNLYRKMRLLKMELEGK
jgi:Nif-specific regulatory protein